MDTEEPPHPPNPELLNRQPKWFKAVFRSCVILSVASAFLLLSMFWPRMRGHHRNVDLTEADSNVRQIGLALMEFETDYGIYPSPTTRPLVEKDFGTTINLSGLSSNALFRQFFATHFANSEQMFYAKIPGIRKTDG